MAGESFRFTLTGEVPQERALELVEQIRKMGGRVILDALDELISPSVLVELLESRDGLSIPAVTRDAMADFFTERYDYSEGAAAGQSDILTSMFISHAYAHHGYGNRALRGEKCDCPLQVVDGADYRFGVDPISLAAFSELPDEFIKENLVFSKSNCGPKRLQLIRDMGARLRHDLHIEEVEERPTI